MVGQRIANSLLKRSAFSSAINVLPNEAAATTIDPPVADFRGHVKPYSEVPGPKELPLIGNSWRFAPLIGE